jgi:hypothetical protein
VKILSYDRSAMNESDHKPVIGVYNCSLMEVVKNEEEKVYQELRRVLAQYVLQPANIGPKKTQNVSVKNIDIAFKVCRLCVCIQVEGYIV